MKQVRSKRIYFILALSVMVPSSVSRLNAEVIFFANGRSMAVKDYRIDGDVITVTFREGGEARFDTSRVTRIAPDEFPEAIEAVTTDAAIAQVDTMSLAARPFAELIESVSVRHGIDPSLVHAVVEAESNYEPRAKSRVGARGLMQVMPATALDFGIRNLYDPQSNLEAGVQYLKFLLTRFNLTQAIAAYNAGPAAVKKYGGIPPFPETRNYVRKVLANFGH
jgi:soluble lytic murein transglycosylase-like protein